MTATSPNQDGVDGTDCSEVWISMGDDIILLMMSPSLEVLSFFFPCKETHFFPLCQSFYGSVNLVAQLVGPMFQLE
jgi:hypothetical protein